MNRNSIKPNPSQQSGAVLLIAIMLLLLASLLSVFALRVGVFEQRTSGNELRARLVRQVADGGLSEAMELLKARPNLRSTKNNWELCPANDVTFPCGAVSDANGRGMYRFVGGSSGANVFNSDASTDVFDIRMLPLTNRFSTVNNPTAGGSGGFNISYGVGAVICWVEKADAAGLECASDPASASSTYLVTLVSVADVPGESSRVTVTKTVGGYSLFNNPSGKPPIVASGSVDVTGTLQIVGNPNGGGPGVPVSIWTRKDVAKTGTTNTCYADEFFRYNKGSVTPTLIPTSASSCPADNPDCQVLICDACQCDAKGAPSSLSFDSSGNLQQEGIDILDVEAGTDSETGYKVGGHVGANFNVRSDAKSFAKGICEFPPDLFAFVFNTSAWEDVDGDCFAEKKKTTEFTNPNTGVVVTIGADEAYLYTNSTSIINATTAGQPLAKPSQLLATGYPSSAMSGLIWCQSTCDIGSNQQLGSPLAPVVLVIDGSARIQGRVFGLVFVRTLAPGNATLTPATGYTLSSANIAAGGAATLDMNAGSAIYGSLVVQGKVDKANGTAAIIYDAKVLGLLDAAGGERTSSVPGSWTDRYRY